MEFYYWLFYNLFTVLGIVLIFKKRDFIEKHHLKIMTVITTLLAYMLIERYIYPIVFLNIDNFGTWSLFHICHLASVLVFLYFMTRDKRLYPFIYFLSSYGLISVIAPWGHPFSMDYSGVTRFAFTFNHWLLTMVPFYLVMHSKYVPSWKDMFKVYISLTALILLIVPLALYLNEDMFMLIHKMLIEELLGTTNMTLYLILYSITNFGVFVLWKIIGNELPKRKNLLDDSHGLIGLKTGLIIITGILLAAVIVYII